MAAQTHRGGRLAAIIGEVVVLIKRNICQNFQSLAQQARLGIVLRVGRCGIPGVLPAVRWQTLYTRKYKEKGAADERVKFNTDTRPCLG